MIILPVSSYSLRASIGEAISTVELPFVTFFADVTDSSMTESSSLGTLGTVGYVETSPAEGIRRVIKNITICNPDDIAHTVALDLVTGASTLPLWRFTLQPGETWDYLRPAAVAGTGGDHAAVTVSDTDTVDLTLATQALSAAVKLQMSLTSDTSGVKLDGDEATPGNSQYYGTDGSGTKGFHALPDAGGAKPDAIYEFPAGSSALTETAFAPFEYVTGTNGKIGRHRYDDTTEEFLGVDTIKLPSDLNTGGTVAFELDGAAVTAAASKNVEFTVYHSAVTDSEATDATFATVVSGDLACDATQGDLDQFSWTATVADLGWAASDLVRTKRSRTAPSANNLTGDYAEYCFRIRVPRS